MDETSRWAMSSLARCNESKYHLPNGRACKLYVEQSMLFSLFLKKIIFNVCMLMDVLTFRWVIVIAKYFQSETVAELFYATCFCNVYTWILIKYKLHFDFLVVFTPPKALSTSLPCFVVIVLLKSALTSGRTLPGTTFFVLKFEATLQPLCSADRDSEIFCTAATALFIAPSCNIHSYIPHFSWSLCLWFTYWVTEYLVFCFLPRRTPPYLVGLSISRFFSVPSPWNKFSMVCRAPLLQINQSNPGWQPIMKQVSM